MGPTCAGGRVEEGRVEEGRGEELYLDKPSSDTSRAAVPDTASIGQARTRAKQAALVIATRAVQDRQAGGEAIGSVSAVARIHAEVDLWPELGAQLLELAEAHPEADGRMLAGLHRDSRQQETDAARATADAAIAATMQRIADLEAVEVAPEVPAVVRKYLDRRRDPDSTETTESTVA
jgi:hypothetical protein